ncbi:DUF2235 domain-containing protein [Jannaschia sp. Os4]|uniref:T6SS phospholipase effector Tle1-like catalytic domain-containing protein n=1 Tax=Jannaschia sp. Os4 TaxID=2807617 RepID=UPI001939D0F6|nr:DUF2235 domain-containing protein [Jannaschia sp. Os4]MBM2578103.1 DUF2235 domain-containing protein [Jannaschia sp. Os4]
MTDARDPIAARADAAVAEAGLSGDVTSVAATCPKTALEIGCFFDGTFNNAVNAGIGGETGSYANARSNVSLLSDVYKDGDGYDVVNENGTGVCRKFRSEYFPGIGTTDGEEDSRLTGGAFGMGSTGVESIVANAAIRIGTVINEASPGIEPEEIVLDVFGFSRGAAAARYFVNAFRQGFVAYEPWIGRNVYGRLPEDRNIRIRFVGVFDTVASIGLAGVEYNYGANVHLHTKQADRIFHITADDEYRTNFPLNDNEPGGGERLRMPGAHGDVGGGYRDQGDTAPIQGTEHAQFPTRGMAEGWRADREATPATAAEAAPWLEDGFILPHQLDAVRTIAAPVRSVTVPGTFGMPMTLYGTKATRVLHRPWVRLGLSRVAMAAMHKAAVEAKAAFLDLPTGGEYEIPGPLRPDAARIIGGTHVRGAAAHFIVNNYAHVSANPDSIGMGGRRDRTRREFPNRPGEAV